MIEMTDRILKYLQHHWALFDLMDHMTKAERKHDDRFENYIDAMVINKQRTLFETISMTNNDVYSQLVIRTLSERDLREFLHNNRELIQGVGVEPMFNYGDIVRYQLPSGETILISLSSPIYRDDEDGIPIEGYYTLPVNDTTNTPRECYTKIRYIKSQISKATENDMLYYKLVAFFERYDRGFGEFKNGDLFYVIEEDYVFSYYDQDVVTLLDAIISGDVKFIATKEDVLYDYIEEGSILR